MKKFFILSLVIVFISIFFTSSYEAKACESGFTSKTVEMVIGNCTYMVDFCTQCGILTHPGTVSITGFRLKDRDCNSGLTFNQVLQQIESQAFTYDFYFTYLCDPINVPPCPAQSQKVTFYHWVCWRMEGIEYFGDFYVYYEPCDYENYCYEECTWCWDPDPDGTLLKTCSVPVMVGTVNCTLEAYQVPKPTVPGEISDCFIYHTPCNP